ncbi:hypothetical protein [Undibacterium sp. TS12]|uniref:hypothetical protein n=1 Tax=Undibacterium sp. TS12 TaxID=2908202 RepID=UPI001F4CD17A|nr:hypothetical protein [Undibacterium sp. TS12]MCH8623020.1 hypothetical protein [Undibacterium sp. TS12]
MQHIRAITRADISNGTIISTACIPYAGFIDKYRKLYEEHGYKQLQSVERAVD